MVTVLNSRMLDAVMTLRAAGQWKLACQVLVDGKRVDAVLGPRVRDCPNSVRVQIAGKVQTVSLGQISVGAEVAAVLQAVIEAQDAAAAEAAAEKALWAKARTDQTLLNELLRQRSRKRRNPSGQFAGNHCERAGRT